MADAKTDAKTDAKKSVGKTLSDAWDQFGSLIKGGGKYGSAVRTNNAGVGAMKRSALGILPHWNPSRPQQLVLAGILVIAFLDLKVASKFGDIWQMAFIGGVKEPGGHPPEPGGSKKEPPIPPEQQLIATMVPPL